MLLQENKDLKEQIESRNKIIEQLTCKMEALVQRVERLEKDKIQDNHIVFKHPETEKNNFPPAFVFSENADNPFKMNCNICKIDFKDKKDLNEHDTFVHMCLETNQYKCDHCDSWFDRKSQLEKHTKELHNQSYTKHTLDREPSLQNHKMKKI